MPRALRITLWILGSLIVLLGLGVLWINSELKPEPLGKRASSLLKDSKIKGGIQKIEAALNGEFNIENIDLVLEDGTAIKATAIKGQADLVASALGTPTLNHLSVKGLKLDLSKTRASKSATPKVVPVSQSTVPTFRLGPFNIEGSVTLEDGKLIDFKTEGTGIDSSNCFDLHGLVAWSGLKVGTMKSKPSSSISIQGEFQRPLGQHGLNLTQLARDIKSVNIDCNAKDENAVTPASMHLTCQGTRDSSGRLVLSGVLNDVANQAAAKFIITERDAELNGEITLALDPTKFGVLSDVLPSCKTNGKLSIVASMDNPENWQSQVDFQIKWSDLSRYSKAIRPGLDSTWRIQSSIANSINGLVIEKLSVNGNGVILNLNKPLHWKPEKNIEEVSVLLSANDAELATFAPLLSSIHVIPTQGRWTGEAELTLNKGDLRIKTVRTHGLIGLTLEREGKVIAQNLSGEIPLRAEEGSLILSPFRIYSPVGDLIRGDLTLKLEKNSDWSLKGKLNLGVAEIAQQSGQPNLPIEKLLNTRVEADVALSSIQSNITLHKVEAKILRQDLELLKIKLRQSLSLNGTKPTGVLFEATAEKLPLESLGVFVPGLNISGSLHQASLVGGFQGAGLFIKSREALVGFSDVSISWNQTPYLTHCNLSTRVDLNVSEEKSLFNFTDVSVQSRGKSLASGSLSVGLNEFTAVINLKGDVGAIAEQPIANIAANLSSGNYQAQLNINAHGECSADLTLSDITFKDRPAKIKSIKLNGNLTSEYDGFRANGSCQINGTGITSGRFVAQKKSSASKSDWQLDANFESILGDDFLAFLSQTEASQVTPTKINSSIDRLPFWSGNTAKVKLFIQSASCKGIIIEKLSAQLDVTDNQINLSQLKGKFADGQLDGSGRCTFSAGNSGGPYQLNAQIGLKQFSFEPITKAYPAIKDFVQGKGDTSATANSVGNNIDDLISKISINANLLSKDGRIQAFGAKDSEIAVSATKAGQTAQLLGGIAKLAGALSKNKPQGEKIARAGEAMTAASKLQKSLSDFKYQLIDIQVQRQPNGTVKINQGLIQNPELTINAFGQITAKVGSDFNDWPLALQANMRGKGTFAEQFKLLGFAETKASTDGFTQGPSVQFSGSLNNLQNDLKDRLQGAVKNIQSGSSQRETSPADPKTNPAVPTINPLELLLGN